MWTIVLIFNPNFYIYHIPLSCGHSLDIHAYDLWFLSSFLYYTPNIQLFSIPPFDSCSYIDAYSSSEISCYEISFLAMKFHFLIWSSISWYGIPFRGNDILIDWWILVCIICTLRLGSNFCNLHNLQLTLINIIN